MKTSMILALVFQILSCPIYGEEAAKPEKSPRDICASFLSLIAGYGKSGDAKIVDDLKGMMVTTVDDSAQKMLTKFIGERFVKQAADVQVSDQVLEKDGIAVCITSVVTEFNSFDVDPFVLIQNKTDHKWYVAGNSKVGLKSAMLDGREGVLNELMDSYKAKKEDIIQARRN